MMQMAIDRAIAQIKHDVAMGDTTAIELMLRAVPIGNLTAYLHDEWTTQYVKGFYEVTIRLSEDRAAVRDYTTIIAVGCEYREEDEIIVLGDRYMPDSTVYYSLDDPEELFINAELDQGTFIKSIGERLEGWEVTA